MNDRSQLLTEQRLPESTSIDAMSVRQIIDLMNDQDAAAVRAVGAVRDSIEKAIERVVAAFRAGGRLYYVGAGTSGRLGVLDASECPPTFRTDPQLVQGIIAGGEAAMFRSQEGAEDSPEEGAKAMDARQITSRDVVFGIAAGGTTPFVRGALQRAKGLGASTIFLCCVQPTPGEASADVVIRPLVGPEIITGSTRLKAGTATKLVLNMVSTIAMIQMGKVYQNLMVDLRATNQKLRDRGARIIASVTGVARETAMSLLQQAEGHVKSAIVMHKRNVSLVEANELLTQADGRLRDVLER